MASTSIQLMDIMAPNRNWVSHGMFGCEDLHILLKGKLHVIFRTYQAGSGVQDIFENLTIAPPPEGQEVDDVYQETIWILNAYFQVQEMLGMKDISLPAMPKTQRRCWLISTLMLQTLWLLPRRTWIRDEKSVLKKTDNYF